VIYGGICNLLCGFFLGFEEIAGLMASELLNQIAGYYDESECQKRKCYGEVADFTDYGFSDINRHFEYSSKCRPASVQ